MDLSKMSIADLRQLEAQIVATLPKRERKEREQAIEQIYAVANGLGLPLKTILQNTKEAKKASSRGPGKTYRDPTNPDNIWKGKGKRPAWLKSALNAGVPLERLLA